MFGWAIFKSTAIITGLIHSTDTGAASADFNYWPNLILQSCLLVATFAYLYFRGFDFKVITSQIKLRLSVIIWIPIIFASLGLLCDICNTLAKTYNWFSPDVLKYIDWTFGAVLQKFQNLPIVMVVYSFLNGFYEEFFFLGLLPTSVKKSAALPFMLLYSTIIRISFHTYQGWTPALITGIGVGLFFYVLYRYAVKNLLPFFVAHAIWDIVGGSLIYLLLAWPQ